MIAPNPEKTLLPGQYANVRLLMGQDQKALLVPEQAILSDQGGNYVLVVQDDGTVASRPVVPTQRIDGKRVIESGLAAGERVLIDHLQQARPGMKVVAQTASPGRRPAPRPRRLRRRRKRPRPHPRRSGASAA